MITSYVVTGMTCGNCVHHVTEEVGALDGVDQVDVTLEGGRMQVTSVEPIEIARIREAVEEAGEYQVQPA